MNCVLEVMLDPESCYNLDTLQNIYTSKFDQLCAVEVAATNGPAFSHIVLELLRYPKPQYLITLITLMKRGNVDDYMVRRNDYYL